MAVIAQSDPYQSLSRKIGYSVGLENLWRNSLRLTDAYKNSVRGLRMADWHKLVVEDFGRNLSAAEHIANFFSSINLLRAYGKEVHPLYGLDALLMLRRHFEDADESFRSAARLVLLLLIIEADGDIFLNCLRAEFDREKSRSLLVEMVNEKWTSLKTNIVNIQVQDRLWDVISIRTHTGGKSSATSGGKDAPFGRRTQPLSAVVTRAPARTYSVEVLDSYLDKVLPTRKGWARDLGLLHEDDALSDDGRAVLKRLASIGMCGPEGAFRFWPYPSDLAKVRLSHKDLGATCIDSWDVLSALVSALGGSRAAPLPPAGEAPLVALLKELYLLYKSGSPTQGSLRHQLPIYVAKPVVAGIYLARRAPLPDLPAFIESEIHGTERRFDLTNIRGTEGALVFR